MNEELANIAVSPLADAEKLLLPSGRVFSRHKAQPCGQITRFLELSAVSNSSKQCGRTESSDSGDCHQPSCSILSISNRFDLACDISDPLFQLTQIFKQIAEQFAHCRRKIVCRILEGFGQVKLEQTCTLPQRHTIFEAERPHLVYQACSCADHLVTHPVQGLKVGLFLSFERSKSHRWSRCGLSDGLRVDDVAFVRLNVRLHKLGRDQPYLVPERLDLPRNPLRPCARFHPHSRGFCPLEELKQCIPSEPNPLDDRAVGAQRHDVEDVLPDINPIDRGRARHIALWHCNLLWFDRLMMREEDEADHPINGTGCRSALLGLQMRGCPSWP